MNYRHAFHAGNFADVFKHALLARLLVYLSRKDAPFRVIDTHAGEGAYDLASEEAGRTMEWKGGIGRLADLSDADAEMRALLAPYLDCVGDFGADARPALYPGSPLIAARLMREQDRAIFCELRPDAFVALRYRFGRDARVKTIHIDGYTGLGAYAPPKERRGLVLIDPPFERTDEFNAMFAAFLAAYRKWPTGVYALWHPSKDAAAESKFLIRFEAEGVKRVLRLSLAVARGGEGLRRTGLVVVNPPFVFEEEARKILSFLAPRLAQSEGAGFETYWLTGE
ncbi:23S rRNA (adenine(2030)-N(6))-methyltransferase RlmJ [Methylocystis parvus]|uniref:Ribosomal RNA large subunit methyltransferase J n=1 Tax=Methylocystis parvus TaxID=134 RepID=A0A6B8M8L4_9HYPH|nr:23S rRNA (adenine(2030)-N(6))-methyltransferase RlmJ [Methylocystis parvus]QGM98908.1 23S rRNA (adenine(2030)-N(6))-methyltransferase RlmJ [Methylocystis parvus]WBK00736.1 23S rRNA (adenine(2030)-N(6))-methyltransferase RlmJ [Methylocystis parvus OBBP]